MGVKKNKIIRPYSGRVGGKSISYCCEAPLNTNGGQALAEEKGEERSGTDEWSWHCEGRRRWRGRKRRVTDAAVEWKRGSEEDSVSQRQRRRKCVENMFAQPETARSCTGPETRLPTSDGSLANEPVLRVGSLKSWLLIGNRIWKRVGPHPVAVRVGSHLELVFVEILCYVEIK